MIDLTPLQRLGIDEIALRKGQEDYITVLIDLDHCVLVGFACSRKHQDIKEVLKGWGTAVLKQVLEASIALSGNYRGLIRKLMPDAHTAGCIQVKYTSQLESLSCSLFQY